MPYTTTVLDGRIDLGDRGIRLVGLLWLLTMVGFIIAGIGLILLVPWWQRAALNVTLFSLGVCILGWSEARYGVYINAIILVFIILNAGFDWIPNT
jgi:uncharacterized BrkB/YihY/UPF0761 family membrane protein